MSKILIGVVTHSKHKHCLDEFQLALEKQNAAFDSLFVVNNGEGAYATLLRSRGLNAVECPTKASTRIEHIVNNRNHIRDYALKNDYDAVLFVDSDVILPEFALRALAMTPGDIVSGAYLNALGLGDKTVVAPVLFKDLGNGECQVYTYEGVAYPQILPIGAAGLGCTFAKRNVLEAVQFRTMGNSTTGGEDMAFYVDARAKGFKTVANTLVQCPHRVYPKDDARARHFEWRKNIERPQEFIFDYTNQPS